jgi:hypothetical protein
MRWPLIRTRRDAGCSFFDMDEDRPIREWAGVVIALVVTVVLLALTIWSASIHNAHFTGVITDVTAISAAVTALTGAYLAVANTMDRIRHRRTKATQDQRGREQVAQERERAREQAVHDRAYSAEIFNHVLSHMPKELGADEVSALANLSRTLPWHGHEVRAIEPPRGSGDDSSLPPPALRPPEGPPPPERIQRWRNPQTGEIVARSESEHGPDGWMPSGMPITPSR